MLDRLRSGRIEVVEGGRTLAFGPASAKLRATVAVHDPCAWSGPLRGSLGLGETYVDGLWETDDLVTLYLSSSEVGFRERRIADVQTLFAKPAWRVETAAAFRAMNSVARPILPPGAAPLRAVTAAEQRRPAHVEGRRRHCSPAV